MHSELKPINCFWRKKPMINYVQNIYDSGMSIYDPINPDDRDLFIPTYALERILSSYLVGFSLEGLPLRTRSKVVKTKICEALGYPTPRSFIKIQPRFPGQNFDVYTQKSMNVQIWNEEVDAARRYVFLKVDEDNVITCIRVISGDTLAGFDRTGKLTTKYQATMSSFDNSYLFSEDTTNVANWITYPHSSLQSVNPNYYPSPNQLLPVAEIYDRLLPLVGLRIDYLNPLQERNRGAELHALICQHLGYSVYEDDGSYPDIANQLLEIKLQTSPTIDLGLHSPEDGAPIATIGDTTFYSGDVRYVIFDSSVENRYIRLNRLYVVAGYEFTRYFPLFKGQNAKIQLPLPNDFFD